MAYKKFDQRSVPHDFKPDPILVHLQRWVAEMFVHTCFAFDIDYDTALLACTYAYNSSNRNRYQKGFWTERVPLTMQISRDTYIRLGLLGVWGLRDEETDKRNFVHSRTNKISAIISSNIFRLPEHLINRGLAMDVLSRSELKPKSLELQIPNGIYLEMLRESDITKVSFNQMMHEAIIQTRTILPLKFGPGRRPMKFRITPADLEKVNSLASIHQININQVLLMILGRHFFVGEEKTSFLTTEEGKDVELWD